MPVTKTCPKCAYVRTAADTAPDWQCPKCGIAYAKFQQGEPAPAAGAAFRPAADRSYTLAAFAHFSILLGLFMPLIAILVPIIIWKTRGDEDEFTAAAAKEAINFQLSFLLWCLGLGIAAIACIVAPPLIYVVLLLLAAVLLAYFVMPFVAGFKTMGGDSYTYPFIKHFFV